MRRHIEAALCSVALGAVAVSASSLAIAQQKTAAACVSGITQRAHLTRCGTRSSKAAGDQQVRSTIKDIMDSIIDPSADVLWGAAGAVIDKQGVQDLSPKTPEEWLNVRRAAVRIIEGPNLLMMPGRDAAPVGAKSDAPGVELEPAEITALVKKGRKSFDAFAKELQDLGLEALRASEAKSVPSLEDIGGRMENVCEGCHQTFWYPQEKPTSTRK